jgi:tetratricopeptide (TPR) repeat protein
MARRERRAMLPGAMLFWIWTFLAVHVQGASNPLAIARAQFDRGDYRAAITTLSSAIDANARDAELWHWRSRCYLELRDYARALADGERAVAERLGDSEFHRWLGRAYGGAAEQKRSFSMARKVRAAFEDAVRLDSSNIAARRDLMEFYVEAPWVVGGDKRKALEQVDAITRLDVVSGHLAHAVFWIRTNRPDAADAEYQQILEARPDRIEPYLEVADFDESRSDAGRLASVVEQSARVAPFDIRLAYYRGVALVLANGSLTEAERVLRVYLATAPRRSDWPSHADAHTWLGRLHEQRGELSAALDEYQSALVLDPESKHAREALRRLKRVAP